MILMGTIAKELREYAIKHEHQIAEIDRCHMDIGVQYMVLMKPGWCVEQYSQHTIMESTAREVLSILRGAAPCDCDDCHVRKEQGQ